MAISGGDGSIILTTKVDQSGLNKGMTSMQKGVNSLSSSFKALGSTIAAVFSITAIINFSKQAGEFATQTEASVQRLVDIYGEAAQSVGDFIDANAKAIGMSKSAGASIAATYGNLLSVWADQTTNAELTNSLLNQTAVVASKTGRTTTDVAERIRSGLLGNTEAIEDLGINVNIKTIEITDAFKRIADGRSWEQLNAYEQSQVRTLAILEQSTNKYGTTVAETTATVRNQYQAAYEDFQNTWGQVVNTVLIPVLKILTQVFTIATKGLQVMAGLSGKTVENSGQTSSNIKQQTKEQEKLNKAVKKGLAGFDEINTLTEQSAENTADAGTGTQISGIGDLGGSLDGSSYVEEVSSTLMAIMGIVSLAMVAVGLILLFTGHIGWGIGFIIAGAGLLAVTMASASEFRYDGIIQMLTTIMGVAGGALLALGIILVYFKILPTGIGMIVAGASLIVSSVVSQGIFNPNDIASWLSIIMGIVGGALLAIGIFLCYMKVYPQGIGLIIAGATSLISAVALGSEDITSKIKGWVAVIMAIAGVALLVLGIILCATGVGIATGIALIAAGAIALVTPIALNWNAIVDNIKKFVFENSTLISLISGGLIILGILLCFAVLPLGIALIAAGAVGLAAVVAVNWNSIKEKVSNAFNAVITWIKTYGLLVIGIILCLTGVGIPLGIALIVKWAKDGVKNGVPLANVIVDKVKQVWNAVKQFWNTYIAPVFTGKFWLDLAIKCSNGLISGFENGVNGIIGLFEKMINWIVGQLNKISFDVPDWVPLIGGKTFGFNIPEAKFKRISIPRLAQGAVIPPNREFLAVLGDQKQGTNIEAPLQTIVDAMNIALAQNGNTGGGNTEVVLEIDGREFGRAVVEQGNRENRRIGTRLVIA